MADGDDLDCPRGALDCEMQLLGVAILVAVCFFGVAAGRYRCSCRRRGLTFLGAGECKLLWTLVGFVCGCFVEFWIVFQTENSRVKYRLYGITTETQRYKDWFGRYTELKHLWWWGITILVFVAVGYRRVRGSTEVQQPLDLHDEVWMMIHVSLVVLGLTVSGCNIFQLVYIGSVDSVTTGAFFWWCVATAIDVCWVATSRARGGSASPTAEACEINELASEDAASRSNQPLTPNPACADAANTSNRPLITTPASILKALHLDVHTQRLEEMGLLERLNEASLSELQQAGLPPLHARTLLSATPGTGVAMDLEGHL